MPFEGSWTAGQVAQHILLSSSSVEVLRGPVKKTKRAPDEGIENLRSIFLDFDTKLESPEFIMPQNKVYDKEELLRLLSVAAVLDVFETVNNFYRLAGKEPFFNISLLYAGTEYRSFDKYNPVSVHTSPRQDIILIPAFSTDNIRDTVQENSEFIPWL